MVTATTTLTPTATPEPTLASSPTPTFTATPKPLAAFTPTPEPSPTLKPTATATPTTETQLDTSDPLYIESLRQYKSDPPPTIEVLNILTENEHFTRYQIAYPSDDLRITGVMNVPKRANYRAMAGYFSSMAANSPRWPVILLNHGHYTPADYYPGKGTELEAAYLAQHGYVTIASDYRGYADSEGPVGSHFDPGWTHDVLNLLDTLPNLDFIDPKRVGIWGHSTGGEIALQIITIRDSVDAVVLFGSMGADAADNLPLVLAEGNHQGEMAIQRYGLPQEAPEVWTKISPITYLADVSTPISIHHGYLDSEVPPALSAHLWQAMQEANLPGEYYTYLGQGHFFTGQAWNLAMERTLAFFDHYVKE